MSDENTTREKREDAPPALSPERRAYSLDALRGLAIFGMCFSGVMPWGVMPSWMYHAQLIPPQMKYDLEVAGYTWVDLVFPAFIFAMGAAIPLAMSRKLDKGVPLYSILWGIIWRYFVLVFYAVYVQTMAPYQMQNPPDNWIWLKALGAFLLLFPIFWRYPRSWNKRLVIGIKTVATIAAICWLFALRSNDIYSKWDPTIPESGIWEYLYFIVWFYGLSDILNPFLEFSRYVTFVFQTIARKTDIIILVLANVSVTGALVWLVSRRSLALRFSFLIFAFLAHLGRYPDLLKQYHLWEVKDWIFWSPYIWVWNFEFQKYLFVIVAGTIAGDLLLKWMSQRGEHPPSELPPAKKSNFARLAWAHLLLVVALHILLHTRLSWVAFTLVAVMAGATLNAYYVKKQRSESDHERLLMSLHCWAMAWLFVGLLIEPITETGIKKDKSTMSYYLVSSGLSLSLLLSLVVWIDFQGRVKLFGALIRNGQNPLMAYVAIRNVLAPITGMYYLSEGVKISIDSLATKWLHYPWPRAFYSLLKTCGLMWLISFITKKKIIWRA